MAITINGIGSGLDVNSIVNVLLQSEGAPAQNRITSSLQKNNVHISSMGAIKSAISEFTSAVKGISESVELAGQEISFGEAEGFSVDQESMAPTGSYSVEIVSSASKQKDISTTGVATGASLGAGEISIFNGDGEEFKFTITDEKSDLANIAKEINKEAINSGVAARVMTVYADDGSKVDKMVFESTKTGADGSFTVSTSSGILSQSQLSMLDTSNSRNISQASDAEIKIDGERFMSSSNTFDKAIDGVKINVEASSVGSVVAMEILTSYPPVEDKLNAFVEAFNEMNSKFKSLAGTGQDGKQTPLENNSLVRQIKSEVRNLISEMGIGTDGSNMTFSSVGIMTDRSGNLELDSERLQKFIDTNGNQLVDFFAASDTGFSDRLKAKMDPFTATGGMIDTSKNAAQAAINRLNTEQEKHDLRMERVESSLFAKFNAMDTYIAQMNTQNNALLGMLNSAMSNGNN